MIDIELPINTVTARGSAAIESEPGAASHGPCVAPKGEFEQKANQARQDDHT
jgi:hypothetical protein